MGVVSRPQRSDGPPAVDLVSTPHVLQDPGDIRLPAACSKFLLAAPGAFIYRCIKVDFERCFRQYYRTDIPAHHYDSGLTARAGTVPKSNSPLLHPKGLADQVVCSHRGYVLVDARGAHCPGYVFFIHRDGYLASISLLALGRSDVDAGPFRNLTDRFYVGDVDALLQDRPGDRSVKNAGIEEEKVQAPGYFETYAALAGSGRPVDGDGVHQSSLK